MSWGPSLNIAGEEDDTEEMEIIEYVPTDIRGNSRTKEEENLLQCNKHKLLAIKAKVCAFTRF